MNGKYLVWIQNFPKLSVREISILEYPIFNNNIHQNKCLKEFLFKNLPRSILKDPNSTSMRTYAWSN